MNKTIIVPLAIILLLALSCSHPTRIDNEPALKYELEDSFLLNHTYTPTGLLDSSFSHNYYFSNNILVMEMHSYTIRNYDAHNKIILEKEFEKDKEGKEYSLTGETTYEYNEKEQLLKETNTVDKRILSIREFEYNEFDSLSKEIFIVQKSPETDEEDNGLGESKEKDEDFVYDTSEEEYKYDSDKKLIAPSSTSTITNASIAISNNEILHIKTRTSNKGFNIDSTWKKDNIISKHIATGKYEDRGYRTLTYYNAKGDEVKLLRYRSVKD